MLFTRFLRSFSDAQSFRFISFSVMKSKPDSMPSKVRKLPDPKFAKKAFVYCADLVKRRDYENYLALMLMPKLKQPRIIAALALNVEVSTIRQKIKRNSGVTGIYQLQFWKDALNILFGYEKGPIPRQPVVTALHAFGDRTDLELYQKLVESRQETLGDRQFETVKKLEENGRNVHGTLIQLIGSALGDPGNAEFVAASEFMGAAVGVITLVRATIPLLREGILLLPTDLMTIHGLSGDKIFNNKNPEAFKELIKSLITVAEKNLDNSRNLMAEIPKELRPALLASGFKTDYLIKILRKNKFNLFQERIQKPHPLASWQLWWRNMRKVF